jgi:hypothetical protein
MTGGASAAAPMLRKGTRSKAAERLRSRWNDHLRAIGAEDAVVLEQWSERRTIAHM